MTNKGSKSNGTVFDPTIPEHELRLECSIRIWGRNEEIVNIKPSTAYPLGLHPSFCPQTASTISKLLEMLVLQPVQVMLNIREHRLFEAEAQQMEQRIKAGGGGKSAAAFADGQGTHFTAPSPEFLDPLDDFARLPVDEEDLRERIRAA